MMLRFRELLLVMAVLVGAAVLHGCVSEADAAARRHHRHGLRHHIKHPDKAVKAPESKPLDPLLVSYWPALVDDLVPADPLPPAREVFTRPIAPPPPEQPWIHQPSGKASTVAVVLVVLASLIAWTVLGFRPERLPLTRR